MKAILINSAEKSISEVEIPKQNALNGWYEVLEVEMVEVGGHLSNRDDLLVDEEGLLGNSKNNSWFQIKGVGQGEFIGNGLIVRADNAGNSISCLSTIEDISKIVTFL